MRRISIATLAFAGAAAIALAQSSPAPQPTVPASQSGLSPSLSNGSGMQISTGTVTEYKPGQRIAVRISEDNTVKLDLDKNVHVDGLVAEGQLAAVLWTSAADGTRRVMSITAAPGPGDSGTANLASSYQQMSEPVKAKGAVTPGASTTAPATILTPAETTPRATRTPRAPRPTPTPVP
ncbi:MAG TPA: hypothetical protein VGG65_06930 [Thermoanaerobaculia bacterium]|jgi:hypothetical protein